jgi:hypothetical protein
VRQPQRSHCVGDQSDLPGAQAVPRQLDHGGMHVQAVHDQAGDQLTVHQRGPRRSGCPRADRAHRVEQVGDAASTDAHRGRHLFRIGIGVSDADDHPALDQCRDDRQRARQLRGDGDHGDAVVRTPSLNGVERRCAQMMFGMSARATRVQERPLHVHTQRTRCDGLVRYEW